MRSTAQQHLVWEIWADESLRALFLEYMPTVFTSPKSPDADLGIDFKQTKILRVLYKLFIYFKTISNLYENK